MEGLAQSIIIPVKGLKNGGEPFVFEIDGTFFQAFGNGRIKDADCTVRVEVERQSTLLRIRSRVGGFVVVECDRCLEDLTLKVDVDRVLTAGIGIVEVDDSTEEEDVVLIDSSDAELDISQFVYDYICLSLPLVMVHPEGKCNPDMIRRMQNEPSSTAAEAESPFGVLKDMIGK